MKDGERERSYAEERLSIDFRFYDVFYDTLTKDPLTTVNEDREREREKERDRERKRDVVGAEKMCVLCTIVFVFVHVNWGIR